MVQLTEELIAAFNALKVVPLATADRNGVPNVAPMGAKAVADPETILIMNNFMQKTLANVKENPKAAVYLWGDGVKGCYQIKGDVEYVESGEQFEAFRADVTARLPHVPAVGMLKITVTDVFNCAAGPNAGDRIL
ncbi:pyridoxamine 5-phosphate oxidase [Methanomicrobiaceae archaeon CYW5]|uniref:pyridoxamine 5'-phosphate oxidase family protein n=1 Tax=Methanovulcanius yangii TaxID=1789227 RepID=UPI0029CA3D4E|nr:pyridoxamine 5'-phosphate oxidase family protein [Methanovulcanius yangii]MBT8508623.1 pyridoxamine 5-phosphate oxidase [Methanovulcanius yangii]